MNNFSENLRKISMVLILSATLTLQAQEIEFEIPTTNSRAKVEQRLAATDITVNFNRPSVKGRKIFGALVPYGQVWRTGSDASTKISFSTDVLIGGKDLPSGEYELFTIPNKNQWTIILQANRNQWGSYGYDPQYDVLRADVPAEMLKENEETFSMTFENVTARSADLVLSWESTRVRVPIIVDLKKTVLPGLEKSLEGEGRKPYFRAAMFYFENDLDINRAAELMELAISQSPNHLGMLHRQALILKKKGDKSMAIQAAEKSLELARESGAELREEYTKLNEALLRELRN